MSLTLFVGVGIGVIIISMIFFVLKVNKSNANNKPYLLSFSALGIIILHWILYLFNFYATIPEKIGDLIISPAWAGVFIIGLISAYKEFKNNNNRRFGVVNGGLAIISGIVGVLTWGIGNM